ncbi:uncharacterized protein B0I36DRAFT_31481 [Microdochium trichocladiopsis]|uniref:Uncharacterized protein n=1 Tax=Microdochium trichocladiopsis TaxID=1682393 RepID=A0A9P8XZE3_9PEZI|nr:uncharacterized protein B0I36DRAFT_31481 [Microdochium trichocladiopsis]KAH7021339.1 hypothetical protein B0I36DRAFT_31481 [Microdochium trichocladiopsis]
MGAEERQGQQHLGLARVVRRCHEDLEGRLARPIPQVVVKSVIQEDADNLPGRLERPAGRVDGRVAQGQRRGADVATKPGGRVLLENHADCLGGAVATLNEAVQDAGRVTVGDADAVAPREGAGAVPEEKSQSSTALPRDVSDLTSEWGTRWRI